MFAGVLVKGQHLETQAWNCFLKAASDLQRGRETDGGGGKPGRRASRVGKKKKEEKQSQLKGKALKTRRRGRGGGEKVKGE